MHVQWVVLGAPHEPIRVPPLLCPECPFCYTSRAAGALCVAVRMSAWFWTTVTLPAMLCVRCNAALGLVRESPRVCKALAVYAQRCADMRALV